MNNELRLSIQYEILKFLENSYYHLGAMDEEESNVMARQDSYKIMTIIVNKLDDKKD